MAKVKGMAATKYIGSLGPQVFYMRNGQNIVREKAASVSNPQTTAQMNQRIKMGNVINLYRLNKAWMEKYAFPLRPAKQSVYNAFVSANLTGSEVSLTKQQYQAGFTVLEPMDFTKGSLPQMRLEYDDDTAFISDIVITRNIANISLVKDISKELLDHNSWLKDGDQLSIIFNATDTQGYGQLYACEFTIDLGDETEVTESSGLPFILMCSIDDTGETKYLEFVMDELPQSIYAHAAVIGALFIVSRKTSNGIDVTTSRMELNTYDVLNQYNTPAARRAARRSYGAGDTAPFLAPGYGGGDGGSSITPAILSVNDITPSLDNVLNQPKTDPMVISFNTRFEGVDNIMLSFTFGDTGDKSTDDFVTSNFEWEGSTITIPATVFATNFPNYQGQQVSDVDVSHIYVRDGDGNVFAKALYKEVLD